MKLKIGNVRLENPLVLGPMHGVNCAAFRLMCREQGAALVTTSMLHAPAIIHHAKRLELIADFTDEERPLSVQIIGNEPKAIKEAVKIIEPHADVIDLNFGCPDLNITRQKMGAYFSNYPEKARKIMSAAVGATGKPVTVKFRSGWDGKNLNYLKAGKVAEDCGASAITLHARTMKQRYSGKADWGNIKDLKSKVSIPVIGNGDIWSPGDAKRMLDETGCDFAMIARGAMGNPHIFRRCAELIMNNRIAADLTGRQKLQQLKKFVKLYYQHKTRPSFAELKRQAIWFCSGMDKATEKRRRVADAKTEKELLLLIRKGL